MDPLPEAAQIREWYTPAYPTYHELEAGFQGKTSVLEQAKNRVRLFLLKHSLHHVKKGSKFCGGCCFLWKILQPRFGGIPGAVPGRKILDIGCGDGAFVYLMHQAGWDAHGIELDSNVASRAKQRGLQIEVGSIETSQFADDSFDVIRIWHVFEHVRDPKMALERIRRWLRPGGELILGVPNQKALYHKIFGARWAGWESPFHLFQYNAKNLAWWLESAGFKIRSKKFTSVGTGHASIFRGRPSLISSAALPIFVGLDWLVMDRLGLGDGLEFHAIKT